MQRDICKCTKLTNWTNVCRDIFIRIKIVRPTGTFKQKEWKGERTTGWLTDCMFSFKTLCMWVLRHFVVVKLTYTCFPFVSNSEITKKATTIHYRTNTNLYVRQANTCKFSERKSQNKFVFILTCTYTAFAPLEIICTNNSTLFVHSKGSNILTDNSSNLKRYRWMSHEWLVHEQTFSNFLASKGNGKLIYEKRNCENQLQLHTTLLVCQFTHLQMCLNTHTAYPTMGRREEAKQHREFDFTV